MRDDGAATGSRRGRRGWSAVPDTHAWNVLVIRDSGKALDVHNQARITQWSRNDGSRQQGQFVDFGGDHYRLKSRLPGKVLDVYNWSGHRSP